MRRVCRIRSSLDAEARSMGMVGGMGGFCILCMTDGWTHCGIEYTCTDGSG